MCQFRIILLLVTSFVVIEGQFEDLTTVTQIADQILIKQTGLDCALYLNANGVVGCQGKSAGVLQAVKDLSSFVETECIAVVAADYFLEFIGQYKLHYKLQRYVKGILVDVRDNPERFSPAAKFPLSNYAPYSNVTYAWNPYGADILNSQFDIPVFLMLDDQSAKVQQRAAVNAIWGYKGVSHIGELDSESLAREDKNAKQCIYNQNCYPLGGYSVVAQYPPYTASEKDTILVIAQMDARAMFRGIMMGAESAASGLVALLTVVQLISQQSLTLAQQYNKQLVFAVLAGEPFDYMGTKSLQWQIQQGLISGLTFDKISAILEFNMLGSKNSSSLYVHGNDNSMLNQFVTISSDVKNGGGPGVPPSSIMSWMLLNSSYPAIVLSDFNLQFETTYYRSFADYITDMERDINVNLTADGAIAGARFLHALAGGQQELSIDRDTVHSIVSNLYTCLQTVNPGLSCPIAQQLMSYSLQGSDCLYCQILFATNLKRSCKLFKIPCLRLTTNQVIGGSRPKLLKSLSQPLLQCRRYSVRPYMGIKRKTREDGTIELREGIKVTETFVYPSDNSPVRLTEILQTQFPTRFPTVTSAKKAVRRHFVILDQKMCKVDDVVQPGQIIQLLNRVAAGVDLNPEQSPLKIQVVYEDDSIGCVIKPPGIQTQGGVGAAAPTLSSCLKYVLEPAKGEGLLHRPREVHRLDCVTGGLILAAKSRKALEILGCSFSERKIKKRYRAIVHGEVSPKSGQIDKLLDDKNSVTEYMLTEVLTATNDEQKKFSVLDLWPQTGRYHQIRRHLAYIGHPICGDPLFEKNGERRGAKRQKVDNISLKNGNNINVNMENNTEADSTGQNTAQQQDDQNGPKSSSQLQTDICTEDRDDEMNWSDESIDVELKDAIKNRLKNKSKSSDSKNQPDQQQISEKNPKEKETLSKQAKQTGNLEESQIGLNEAGGGEAKIASTENVQNKEQQFVKKDKKEAPIVNIQLKCEQIVEDAFQGDVMLWAAGLHFVHPMDGRIFQIDLDEPAYFEKFRNELIKQ
eukprot:TRINITY_DN787_c0_g1_i18.p1 TRINITY_DN787_c0_g1~~TRINITY_DN787_c0_g1_i18.p1  ORF type:complete len:1029 (+),score=160.21 TRINITY_DN787_c0_g1_i18:55-3141(+)